MPAARVRTRTHGGVEVWTRCVRARAEREQEGRRARHARALGSQQPSPPGADNATVETTGDRLVLWGLRTAASVMVFGGGAVLVAGVPAYGLLAGSAAASAILLIVLEAGVALIVGGAAAGSLTRLNRRPCLPNERASRLAERPALGGWLWLLAAALVIVPAGLVVATRRFQTEWGRVADLLAMPGLWDGANANMSGVILVPLAGLLTPPLLELLALVSFVAASLVLLPLLMARSPRFPRHYLVCLLLLTSWVVAAGRGAAAAHLAVDAIVPLVDGSNGSPEELATVRDIIGRYTAVVNGTMPALVWTWCGYAAWMPGLLLSRRARTTFAPEPPRDRANDIDALTAPPRLQA